MRVLGIDCGSECTGYGIVDSIKTRYSTDLVSVSYGGILCNKKETLPVRLLHVSTELTIVMKKYEPDVVAVEEVFYSVNAQSALKLGHVRGVALLAAASAGLPVAGYAPLAIKSAVVGYGLAKKEQVQFMVSRLLHLPEPPEPADAADALAIAICHLHTAQTMAGQQGGSTAPNQVTRQPANRSARLSPRARSI